MDLLVDAETIRVRLLDRAPLYDRPDCYEAGVLEALAAMVRVAVDPQRAGGGASGAPASARHERSTARNRSAAG